MSLHTLCFMMFVLTMFTLALAAPNRFLDVTIKSPDGDIIDCVPVLQQPAFDHPLLKNHVIKMKPDYPLKDDASKVGSTIHQLWHANGKCPEETIPIRRTKKETIVKKNSGFPVGRQDGPNRERAIVQASGFFFGAKATMNVWNPKVQEQNEFSLGQLWIMGDSGSNLNTIEVGWHVNPSLYHDTKTRLFTYWTSDGYNATGCYNLNCAGFIQTSNKVALGSTLASSKVNGSQDDIDIRVSKNPMDGHWWVHVGDEAVGYWPPELFTNLESASKVEWGGEVNNGKANGAHTTTQMGSGGFPEVGQGEGKVSYFKNIQVYDEEANFVTPTGLSTFASASNCYDIKLGADKDWGSFFFYGGPGRNDKCP